MNEKIGTKCYQGVRSNLNTELTSANQIETINMLAIPIVTYSFNIVKLTIPDIKKMDSKI